MAQGLWIHLENTYKLPPSFCSTACGARPYSESPGVPAILPASQNGGKRRGKMGIVVPSLMASLKGRPPNSHTALPLWSQPAAKAAGKRSIQADVWPESQDAVPAWAPAKN